MRIQRPPIFDKKLTPHLLTRDASRVQSYRERAVPHQVRCSATMLGGRVALLTHDIFPMKAPQRMRRQDSKFLRSLT